SSAVPSTRSVRSLTRSSRISWSRSTLKLPCLSRLFRPSRLYDPRMLTRREFGSAVGGTLVAAATPLRAQRGAGGDAVLDLADWSYWWYGVERATLARGTVVDGSQMFVERWIPRQQRHPYPIVLVHGGYGQGSDWLRWVNVFVARGYAVYVLDRPGQGRNPYEPFVHGVFDAQAPTFEKVAADLKKDAGDPQVAQTVASMNQPMANNAITQALWKSRGALLVDDIGPAIFVTHGDGEVFARLTFEARP